MTRAAPAPDAPIGVFDSGLGGLTVVRALIERLPAERIVYLGDTARVPYGPKSPETVRRYADEIAHWLLAQGVKAIVVACNTATAHALEHLRAWVPVPVIGVIDAGARAAVAASAAGRVGVIGTSGTVRSSAYEHAIRARAPRAEVYAVACPLFVPLVEEGWADPPVTATIAAEYLAPLAQAGIDALVLGCTHYPLLKPVLARTMGPAVRLVDSAEEVALAVAEELARRGLEAPGRAQRPTHRFAATDAPEQFLRLAQRFLGGVAPIEHVETVAFA
jgi:glutamate racemase